MKSALILALLFVASLSFILFRTVYVDPGAWGSVCLEAGAPFSCTLRGAITYGQYWQYWGWASLLLAMLAAVGQKLLLAVAASFAGVLAVINYNATWGMIGVMVGGSVWLVCARRATGGTAP